MAPNRPNFFQMAASPENSAVQQNAVHWIKVATFCAAFLFFTLLLLMLCSFKKQKKAKQVENTSDKSVKSPADLSNVKQPAKKISMASPPVEASPGTSKVPPRPPKTNEPTSPGQRPPPRQLKEAPPVPGSCPLPVFPVDHTYYNIPLGMDMEEFPAPAPKKG